MAVRHTACFEILFSSCLEDLSTTKNPQDNQPGSPEHRAGMIVS
jgi:hypothetical protein